MARVPYLTPDTAPPAVAESLAKAPQLRVIGMLANAETAFRPWLKFSGTLLTKLALDAGLRELVILQVGRLTGARYEWDQHVPIALAVGITQAEIDALEAGDLSAFSGAARAVLDYAAAFIANEVTDSLHAALAGHLSDREVVELCLVAGHYLMLARTMTALQIDPDPPAGPDELIKLR
jgi:alkylhydroperoxidase family enzyme